MRTNSLHHAISMAVFTLLLGSAPVAAATAPVATLILRNGPILTMSESQPVATQMAIAEGRIIAIDAAVDNIATNASTQTIDLEGKLALPGFIEAHGHLLGIGRAAQILDLRGQDSPEAVVEQVRQAARSTPTGSWIFGRGWDQNLWVSKEFPTHQALSQAVPNHPVKLTRVDGHAAWYNAKAMALTPLARQNDPAGGRIVRDRAQQPTGVLIDTAMDLLDQHIPPMDAASRRRAIQSAFAELARFGITSFHDAGISEPTLNQLKTLSNRGALPVRIYAMLSSGMANLDQHLARGPIIGDRLTVRAIKLMADGALGSRGAALLEAYSDRAEHHGALQLSQDDILAFAQKARRHGFQLATHAIGDKANRTVLDAYAAALRDTHASEQRWRIEHAQIIQPQDQARMAHLGIIASMQPIHCTSDMLWASDRLGTARSAHAYPWQSLRNLGVKLAFGSDAPVESVNPLEGIYAAITRQSPEGIPTSGWQPQEKLSLEDSLHAYTTGAAYAEFNETRKGKLMPGFLADIAVLSKDIREGEPRDVLDTKVLYTIVGGKVVYRAE